MAELRALPSAIALPRVDDLVATLRPDEPLHCLRTANIVQATQDFVAGFDGTVLYAVKCNPEPAVLQAVWQGGVRHFDCASLPEVELVARLLPSAKIHFMHPVKTRRAIATAYAQHGVRDFVIDSLSELEKILAETINARDLGLIIRLALPAGTARYDLSGKFGAWPVEAAHLLRAARPFAKTLGVSFHVGSQCLDPLAWRTAIMLAGQTIRASGVPVDLLDVGGGFPARYPGMEPPPMAAFFAEIDASIEQLAMPHLQIWAEPGRALVATGTALVVQVQMRRDNALYINDGIYGSLSDAGAPGFCYPTRCIGKTDAKLQDFIFFGPTCDSVDVMRGPFQLPANIAEGDWIEITQLGAYGACLRTGFNGFDTTRIIEVR